LTGQNTGKPITKGPYTGSKLGKDINMGVKVY